MMLNFYMAMPHTTLSLFPPILKLFNKGEDQTLLDAMREYAELVKPDLIIIGSKGLCELNGSILAT